MAISFLGPLSHKWMSTPFGKWYLLSQQSCSGHPARNQPFVWTAHIVSKNFITHCLTSMHYCSLPDTFLYHAEAKMTPPVLSSSPTNYFCWTSLVSMLLTLVVEKNPQIPPLRLLCPSEKWSQLTVPRKTSYCSNYQRGSLTCLRSITVQQRLRAAWYRPAKERTKWLKGGTFCHQQTWARMI